MSHLSLSLSPLTTELSALRRSLRDFLAGHDEPPDDWLLMATELVTNAIAVAPEGTSIEVDVSVTAECVELRVVDMGYGFALQPRTSVPPSAARGRGLMMVKALADDFAVSIKDGRTIATASQNRTTFEGVAPG